MCQSKLSLFVLSVLSFLCLSGASRAEGFWEAVFGGASTSASVRIVYSGQGAGFHRQPRHKHHFASHRKLWGKVAAYQKPNIGSVPKQSLRSNVLGPANSGIKASPKETASKGAQEAMAALLIQDKTLRPGDAFMTSEGLVIYAGNQKTGKQFVSIQEAQVGKDLKARLAEFESASSFRKNAVERSKFEAKKKAADSMNFARHDPKKAAPADQLIRTADGKTIRLVGGFAGVSFAIN